jgi:hypothetical protein
MTYAMSRLVLAAAIYRQYAGFTIEKPNIARHLTLADVMEIRTIFPIDKCA